MFIHMQGGREGGDRGRDGGRGGEGGREGGRKIQLNYTNPTAYTSHFEPQGPNKAGCDSKV